MCYIEQRCIRLYRNPERGTFTPVHKTMENETRPAEQFSPVVLEFGDVSALGLLILLCSRRDKLFIGFCLGFRAGGCRVLSVHTKQSNDLAQFDAPFCQN